MARTLGFLALLIGMGVGIYLYAKQAQTSSAAAGANNPRAAVNITGVRTDLMNIAQAERGYFASEGKYASLDELISSRSITVARQRPPYTYEIETTGTSFRVIATRTQDDNSGTPAQLSVDQDMQFQQSQ
jgi:hypothetical protein